MSSVNVSPAAAGQSSINTGAPLAPKVSASTIKEGSWSAWAISKTVTYHANPESGFPNLVAKIIARFFVNAEEAGKFLGTRKEAAAFLLGHWNGDEKVAQTEAVRIADKTFNNPIFQNLMAALENRNPSAKEQAKLISRNDSFSLCVIDIKLRRFRHLPSEFTHQANLAMVILQDKTFRPLEERYIAQFTPKSSYEIALGLAGDAPSKIGDAISNVARSAEGAMSSARDKLMDTLVNSRLGTAFANLLFPIPDFDD